MYSADLSALVQRSIATAAPTQNPKNAADFNQSTKVRAGSMKDSAISFALLVVAKDLEL